MPLNDTPQKAAINSKIEDLVKDKYLGMEKSLFLAIVMRD